MGNPSSSPTTHSSDRISGADRMATVAAVFTRTCWNVYGLRTHADLDNPTSPTHREYFVQTCNRNWLPQLECFTTGFAECAHTFAILPTVFDELQPVFDFLEANPPERQIEFAYGMDKVSTVYLSRGPLPLQLHNRVQRILSTIADMS